MTDGENIMGRTDEPRRRGADIPESQLFQFLEAVPVGVFVLDRHGKPFYANETARELLGRGIAPDADPDQLAQVYRTYVAGTDTEYPAYRMPVVRAMSGETTSVDDMEIRHPDRRIALQVWAAPVLDADGSVAYAIAAFSDITERKRLEKRLAVQYGVARTLAEASTLRETAANILKSICESTDWDFGALWQVDRNAGMLRCVDAWHHPSAGVEAFDRVTRSVTFSQGIGLPGRVWATGKPAWIVDVTRDANFPRAKAAAAADLHGAFGFPILFGSEVIGVIEFFSREIREPDEEVLRMLSALGSQVGQFVERMIAEEGLKDAKEAAERATRSKSEFLAVMSHELRTPLNAVIGMTALLLETRLSPLQSEYAETIRASGESLLSVINDLLDFSRLESTKLELEKVPVDPAQCIEEAFDILSPAARGKKIDLIYSVDPDVPHTVIGDPTRLRQVIVNLAGNALKFTERGEIVVAAKVRGRDGPSLELLFAVRDTGIGIPPEKLGRLFQPYTQAESSTARRFGGTGLGLAICRRLVELMGGTIWAESAPGEGSTFSFTFKTEAGPPAAKAYPRNRIPQLSGRRVLIAGDNPTALGNLREHCERWGMSVRAVSAGEEALAVLDRGERFDAVVIDLQTAGTGGPAPGGPAIDGPGLGREIRRREAGAMLPLVLLAVPGNERGVWPAEGSGTGSGTGSRTGSGIGSRPGAEGDGPGVFAAVIPKPLKVSSLFDALMTIFAQAAPMRSAVRTPSKIDSSLAARRPMSILIAEDNPVNQKVLGQILRQMGYEPGMASNGREAIRAFDTGRYDLIFMDVEMPEMDGLEATRAIRESRRGGGGIVIVGTTAYASGADRQRCLDAGMNDHLPKPIRIEDLARAIERWGEEITARSRKDATGAPATGAPMPGPAAIPGPVDAARLEELGRIQGGNSRRLTDTLIDLYLEESAVLIRDLAAAVRKGDLTVVQRTAHRLRGSSANLGVVFIAERCRLIEEAAREGRAGDIGTPLGEIEREYGVISGILGGLKRPPE